MTYSAINDEQTRFAERHAGIARDVPLPYRITGSKLHSTQFTTTRPLTEISPLPLMTPQMTGVAILSLSSSLGQLQAKRASLMSVELPALSFKVV